MKRIDITVDGQLYSVSGREPEELRQEISARSQEPGGFWLEVNAGEGQPRPTSVRITAGTTLALTPIPDDPPRDEPPADERL